MRLKDVQMPFPPGRQDSIESVLINLANQYIDKEIVIGTITYSAISGSKRKPALQLDADHVWNINLLIQKMVRSPNLIVSG